MAVILTQVVPWGRSLEEYRLMFDLDDADLGRSILGCGDGPASFNQEMTALGGRVVSCDPIYVFSQQQIEERIAATYDQIISQVKQTPEHYRWHHFQDADDLGRHRLATMRRFLADYEAGVAARRYQAEALPTLRFADRQFDLALCSHLLFLYSEQLSLDFHLAAVRELCRVAPEVRIFPLLGLDCKESPHLATVQAVFASEGFVVERRRVPYEFQRGGDQMLRITARERSDR